MELTSGVMGQVAQIAVPQSETERRSHKGLADWKTLTVLGLVAWLYVPILIPLVKQWWSDPNFSHGFFVPLFVGFVLWQNRARLASVPQRPSTWGLPVVLLGICTLILGVFGAELFLSRVSLILLAGGLVIFFHGWGMLRMVLFPLLFLTLMIPIPAIILNQITLPLQFFASKLAAWSLPQ